MTDVNVSEIGIDENSVRGVEAAVVAMNLDDDGKETPPSLQTIPTDILRHALLFVGNVPDFLSCERTCVSLRSALSDVKADGDAVWRGLLLSQEREAVVVKQGFLPDAGTLTHGEFLAQADADPRFKTNREIACVHHVLQRIQAVQSHAVLCNVLSDGLGFDGWMRLVSRAVNELGFRKTLSGPQDLTPWFYDSTSCTFRLRGDSSAVLSELLQQDMIDLLERANSILADEMGDHRMGGNNDAYPCLEARHLRVVYQLAGNGSSEYLKFPRTYAQCSKRLFRDDHVRKAESVLPQTVIRDKVIRSLSLKAGVVKLHADAFRMAWSILVHRMVAMVEKPVLELIAIGRHGAINERRPLESAEAMWHTPPYPTTVTETALDGSDDVFTTIYCTIVPRQLEDTARALGMRAHRVYIHGWHVPKGSSPEEAKEAAAREYAIDGHHDVCMMDAGPQEGDEEYVAAAGSENESDADYLSSGYSSEW